VAANNKCNTNDSRDLNWGATWVTLSLPFFEQDNLYRQYNLKLPAKDTKNKAVVATELKTFLCPSDRRAPAMASTGQNLPFPMARGNYGANIGFGRARTNGVFTAANRRGLFHVRQQWGGRIADVIDGTSNTVAVGELVVYDRNNDGSWGLWAFAGGATVSSSNEVTAGNTTSVLTPNGNANNDLFKDWTPHCPNGLTDPIFRCEDSNVAHSVRSRHSGGANIALCDGSVRFVSNNVAAATWRAMFTIAGGEVLTLP
jgi:prepilin-type processing-associated H-X9-DG protein